MARTVVIITLACQADRAAEIGYLFGKHPQSLFRREYAAGQVWVFYPEVTDDRLTLAILTEIDPIGLVRDAKGPGQLDQYVNDRPYVASSLTSVAIQVALRTALSGTTSAYADRLEERFPWEVTIAALDCDGGLDLITRIFAPLGYRVTATVLELDLGDAALAVPSTLYRVVLNGAATVRTVISHLYVLIPVLDNSKHYYIDAAETEKLLAHGADWLPNHPARDLITHRYLRYRTTLVQSALDRLRAASSEDPTILPTDLPESVIPEETVPGLHELRLRAVLDAAQAIGATALADLGCGEGRLLELALKTTAIPRLFGMDVAPLALARAARRLKLEHLSEAQRGRITLSQGSLVYVDDRLTGFDVAALVEVIEHLDPYRLATCAHVVFGITRPRRVVVTTPNRDYNALFPDPTRLRHRDHRFEWTRAEGCAWAEGVAARYGYRMTQDHIGTPHVEFGAPTQIFIFDRLEAPAR